MSHMADVDVSVNDLEALEEVCKKRGWILQRGAKSYRWVGRWYDDSPVPRSLFADEAEYRRVVAMGRADRTTYMEAMLGKCEHRIEVPGHFCQVGVVKVGEDLRLVWDWASTLDRVMGHADSWNRNSLDKLSPFLHDYAECSLTNLLANADETFTLSTRTTLADGSLLLEYESP